jgi:hypothetical protein
VCFSVSSWRKPGRFGLAWSSPRKRDPLPQGVVWRKVSTVLPHTKITRYGSRVSASLARDDVERVVAGTTPRSRGADRVRVIARLRPRKRKRAQGRPGAGLHPWSACNKKARGRTTGTAGATGLPCAMVLRLIRALPGDQALLSPLLRNHLLRSVAPALGRQDHTTSPSASRHSSDDTPRPSHPAPNTRDDREAPLLWVRDKRRKPLIWGQRKAEYFSSNDWTTQISLNRLMNFIFARRRFSEHFRWSVVSKTLN